MSGDLHLDTSLGVILIGTFLNVWLYGVVLVQVSIYFTAHRDRTWIILVVAWLTVLETLITAFHVGFVYRYTITLFGNVGALAHSHWFFHMSPLLTVSIASTVQGFFAWRISRLTGHKWAILAIGALITAQFVAGAITTSGAFKVVDFARFGEYRVPIVLWLVTSAATDVVITSTLTWYLHTHRTGFPRTDDLITKLIRLTVQTGLITTIWAVVDLIVFLTVPTSLHLLFNLPLCKLYTSSLLSTLNARAGWEETPTSRSGAQSIGGISIPASFSRDKPSVRILEQQEGVIPMIRITRRVEMHADKSSFELEEYSKAGRESTDVERNNKAKSVTDVVRLQSVPSGGSMTDDWSVKSPSSYDAK